MISPITPWSENVRGHLQRETFGEDKTHKKLPTCKVWVGRLPTLPTHMHKYTYTRPACQTLAFVQQTF